MNAAKTIAAEKDAAERAKKADQVDVGGLWDSDGSEPEYDNGEEYEVEEDKGEEDETGEPQYDDEPEEDEAPEVNSAGKDPEAKDNDEAEESSRWEALFEHATWKEHKLKEKRAVEATKHSFAPKINSGKYRGPSRPVVNPTNKAKSALGAKADAALVYDELFEKKASKGPETRPGLSAPKLAAPLKKSTPKSSDRAPTPQRNSNSRTNSPALPPRAASIKSKPPPKPKPRQASKLASVEDYKVPDRSALFETFRKEMEESPQYKDLLQSDSDAAESFSDWFSYKVKCMVEFHFE